MSLPKVVQLKPALAAGCDCRLSQADKSLPDVVTIMLLARFFEAFEEARLVPTEIEKGNPAMISFLVVLCIYQHQAGEPGLNGSTRRSEQGGVTGINFQSGCKLWSHRLHGLERIGMLFVHRTNISNVVAAIHTSSQ